MAFGPFFSQVSGVSKASHIHLHGHSPLGPKCGLLGRPLGPEISNLEIKFCKGLGQSLAPMCVQQVHSPLTKHSALSRQDSLFLQSQGKSLGHTVTPHFLSATQLCDKALIIRFWLHLGDQSN